MLPLTHLFDSNFGGAFSFLVNNKSTAKARARLDSTIKTIMGKAVHRTSRAGPGMTQTSAHLSVGSKT